MVWVHGIPCLGAAPVSMAAACGVGLYALALSAITVSAACATACMWDTWSASLRRAACGSPATSPGASSPGASAGSSAGGTAVGRRLRAGAQMAAPVSSASELAEPPAARSPPSIWEHSRWASAAQTDRGDTSMSGGRRRKSHPGQGGK